MACLKPLPLLWLLSLLPLLQSCPAPADATSPATTPAPGTQPYGLDGTFQTEDILTLQYLSFPQSYTAIKDRFGFPAYRDSQADYYKLPNGNWAAIYYDSSGNAIAYSFSDSDGN
ncbi:hypothetical protein H6F88_00210 [Oculatella sp. FACHB-28]|uniref:hypothetical protein n=1 Tax=Oculatella sp. FACHB-28 TaxID=2692845 RepID=UPI001687F71C|nr:hypothetical protein [Oculatella sp. FACHB-28]MBD2054472.1 hypothetical protein [Oculatella sp. FACHB-28]